MHALALTLALLLASRRPFSVSPAPSAPPASQWLQMAPSALSTAQPSTSCTIALKSHSCPCICVAWNGINTGESEESGSRETKLCRSYADELSPLTDASIRDNATMLLKELKTKDAGS